MRGYAEGRYAVDAVVQFMNSALGRLLRIGLGVAIVAYGLTMVGGTVGYVVAAVGLVPIALGASGRCLIELVAPRSR